MRVHTRVKKLLLITVCIIAISVAICPEAYAHRNYTHGRVANFREDVVKSTILQPQKIIKRKLLNKGERSKKHQQYLLREYIKKQAAMKAGTYFKEDRRSELQKSRLTKQEFEIYKAIKKLAVAVSQGKEESTEIKLSLCDLGIKDSYSAEELGVDKIFDETGSNITAAAIAAINKKLDVKLEKIVGVVNADMPFELYWFDKTAGIAYQPPKLAGLQTSKGDFIVFENDAKMTFSMAVSSDYGVKYHADSKITGNAYKASLNAGNIVARHRKKSDLKKLEAYRDEIIKLVDYDYGAVDKYLKDGIYGNPWQVIYVFDNKKDTNVVCEGYSKAFQYLCDLSEFKDKGLICNSVSGEMISDTGEGPHMWNSVTIGQKSYHVDLTNIDSDGGPKNNELFLNGVNGSIEKGYQFSWDKKYIYYSYDNLTRHVFSKEILSLSDHSYYEDMKNPNGKNNPKRIRVGNIKRFNVSKKLKSRLLSWSKVKSADKYQIAYKKTGSKKWIYRTIRKTKFVVKKFKKGQKYYFKVRAIRTVNKKVYYGKWTKVKKIK